MRTDTNALAEPLVVGNVISEEHSVDHDRTTKYSGPPTHENTKAWEDLIQRKGFPQFLDLIDIGA
jgi:hypothetical protein